MVKILMIVFPCDAVHHLSSGSKNYCCDNNCNTCFESTSYECLSCYTGSRFYKEATHECLLTCGIGYYDNPADYIVLFFISIKKSVFLVKLIV